MSAHLAALALIGTIPPPAQPEGEASEEESLSPPAQEASGTGTTSGVASDLLAFLANMEALRLPASLSLQVMAGSVAASRPDAGTEVESGLVAGSSSIPAEGQSLQSAGEDGSKVPLSGTVVGQDANFAQPARSSAPAPSPVDPRIGKDVPPALRERESLETTAIPTLGVESGTDLDAMEAAVAAAAEADGEPGDAKAGPTQRDGTSTAKAPSSMNSRNTQASSDTPNGDVELPVFSRSLNMGSSLGSPIETPVAVPSRIPSPSRWDRRTEESASHDRQFGIQAPGLNAGAFSPLRESSSEDLSLAGASPSAALLSQEIQSRVVEFRRQSPGSMTVMMRPDAGTELRIELRSSRGRIEVSVHMERGDAMSLRPAWAGLQETLALQGVTLADLQHQGQEISSSPAGDALRASLAAAAAQGGPGAGDREPARRDGAGQESRGRGDQGSGASAQFSDSSPGRSREGLNEPLDGLPARRGSPGPSRTGRDAVGTHQITPAINGPSGPFETWA